MRHLFTLPVLVLLAACTVSATQQGELCPGEPPDPIPGPVNWARGVYLEPSGAEHLVAILPPAADGTATLLDLGLDPDTGEPRASRILGVPCLRTKIPGAIRRPADLWV